MDYVFSPEVLNNLSKYIEQVNERNVCMCVYDTKLHHKIC